MAIALGLAVLALILATRGPAAYRELDFLRRRRTDYERAEGEVIDVRQQTVGEFCDTTLTIRFTAKAETYVVKHKEDGPARGIEVGRRLPLWYLKDKPTQIVLANHQKPRAGRAIFALLITVAFAAAFLWQAVFG